MVKVSVIIPTYNAEKYLRDCITSVITQTFKDWELIIVDDGSTDDSQRVISQTLEMLQRKNTVIRITKHKNGGTGSALNTGIKASHGEWIKWLSADDVLKPEALEKLINRVTEDDNNKKKIYYTHYDRVDESGKLIKTYIEPNQNDENNFVRNTILLDHFYGNGSTSIIHRSVFDYVGLFDETVGYQEDYEFWLRSCLIFGMELYLLDINTLKYRIHSGQLTEQKVGQSMSKSDSIRESIYKRMTKDTAQAYHYGLKAYHTRHPKKILVHTLKKLKWR